METNRAEDLGFLVEHEETILEHKDEIHQGFIDNLEKNDEPSKNSVIYGLQFILSMDVDPETAGELADQLSQVIIVLDSNTVNQLNEMDIDEELVRFIIKLSSQFQSELHSVYIEAIQGSKYWRSVETEYTMDNSLSVPGIQHKVQNGNKESIDLTMSVESNLSFISLLIERQLKAMEIFDEELIDDVTYSHIERISEQVEQLEEFADSNEK